MRIDLDDVMQAIVTDEPAGFCTACGAEAYCCEPDARRYLCEECGERKVYGTQELLFMMEGI